MNEFIIEKQCVVYKDVFDNINEILNTIKNTESSDIDYAIEPWQDWVGSLGSSVVYGKKSSFFINPEKNRQYLDELLSLEKDGSEESINKFNQKVNIYDLQLKAFNEIKYGVLHCIDRYLQEHAISDLSVFPDYVDFNGPGYVHSEDGPSSTKRFLDKDMLSIAHPEGASWDGSLGWSESRFDILKHNGNTNREYAIGWHTDRFQGLDRSPGPKQILTATVYLNDDYEGGEVAFLKENNENSSMVKIYKPKAGDITIFPSSSPFYHAAMPIKTEIPKYFIRFFFTWGYEGDKEWYDSCKKFGRDEWIFMEQKRVHDEMYSGKHRKHIVFPSDHGLDVDLNLLPSDFFSESQTNAKDLFVPNVSYIDGRKL